MPALRDIAVVIPVGPREHSVLRLLRSLRGFGEIVISAVDTDGTLAVPDHVRLVSGPAGRARQLNAGVAATEQPWIWMLHADSMIDDRVVAAVNRAPDADYIGYFDLRFHDGPALMAVTALGTWLRSRLLGLPFGDQGLFTRRKVLTGLGGFDERISVGEDHALVWRARHAGIPLRPLGAPLWTSARRYVEHGWWTVTRQHAALTWSQARTWSRDER